MNATTGTGGWHTVVVIAVMLALAGLDLVAAVLAKEWTQHREHWQLIGSAAAFSALFAVFVAGLRYTELTILTFGWIVFLQTAVVMIDWARYGLQLSHGRWAAIAIIIMLQGYLMLGSSPAGRVADDQPVEVAQSSADRAAS